MTEKLTAIETRYKGYRFRSRLEARWAVFLDALRIHWEYEKEGYDLGPVFGKYLPDFFLPTVYMRGGSPGVWLEIKGKYPSDADLHPPFSHPDLNKYHALGALTGHGVALAVGLPNEEMFEFFPWWDNCMCFMVCPKCSAVKIEFDEGNYRYCPRCGHHTDDDIAYRAQASARSARFEHGENGYL